MTGKCTVGRGSKPGVLCAMKGRLHPPSDYSAAEVRAMPYCLLPWSKLSMAGLEKQVAIGIGDVLHSLELFGVTHD